MNRWITSDTHFGHARIVEYCPYRMEYLGLSDPTDIPAMNEALITLWNSYVRPGDEVLLVGDFGMGQIDRALEIVPRLHGDIHLILGNHDRPHPSHSRTPDKREAWLKRYLDAGFRSISMGTALFVGEHTVPVSHFPYTGDHTDEERYSEYRIPDEGNVLIHGHVHDAWQINGRQINVGIDAWGRPLHEDEVVELIKGVLTSLD